MRKIHSLVVVVVSLFLCSAAWAARPVFSNFSADVVTTSHGSTHTSKVYSKDGRSRMEMRGKAAR
jgi:hypothetical protein